MSCVIGSGRHGGDVAPRTFNYTSVTLAESQAICTQLAQALSIVPVFHHSKDRQ